jgi:O-antigen/teichoic acid export membrane protein
VEPLITPTVSKDMSAAPPVEYQAAAPASSLGQQASHGFIWLLAQTILIKLATAAGQVVIAWLLAPQEMGLVMTAYTISGFVGIVQQTGLKEILVARHQHFRRWANAGFWISMLSGFAALITQCSVAPFLGHFYHKLTPLEIHRLGGLLVILGIGAPLTSLAVVPMAQLSNDLRFRTAAILGGWSSLATLVLSIIFAAPPLRLGAYALMLPRPIVAAGQAIWLWREMRPPVMLKLQLRRWRYLASDAGWNVLSWLCGYIVFLGDYLTLGLMHTSLVGGWYYFAYNLSMQTMQAFTLNLWGVLLPTLSKLQEDPARQTAAFLRALRLLAIVAVPLCMLQMAAADPGIHIFFKPKWYPAIRALQILSVGMAMQSVTSTVNSLLMAQRRFRALMTLQGIAAVLFISMVYVGSSLGHDTPPRTADVTVAAAVAIFFLGFGPVFLYGAIRTGNAGWRDIARALVPPFFAGAIAAAAALATIHALPSTLLGQWLRLGASVIVLMVVYIPLVRLLAPEPCADLKARFNDLLARVRRRTTPA